MADTRWATSTRCCIGLRRVRTGLAFRDISFGGNAVDLSHARIRRGDGPRQPERRLPGARPPGHSEGCRTPMMPLRAVCDTDTPAGAYCGTCGAHLSAQRGDGRGGCASAHPRRNRESTCCGCPSRVRCSRTCLIARAHRFGWRWRCCSWRWSSSRCCVGKRRWSRSARSDFLSCSVCLHARDRHRRRSADRLADPHCGARRRARGGMGAGERRTRRADVRRRTR